MACPLVSAVENYSWLVLEREVPKLCSCLGKQGQRAGAGAKERWVHSFTLLKTGGPSGNRGSGTLVLMNMCALLSPLASNCPLRGLGGSWPGPPVQSQMPFLEVCASLTVTRRSSAHPELPSLPGTCLPGGRCRDELYPLSQGTEPASWEACVSQGPSGTCSPTLSRTSEQAFLNFPLKTCLGI